MAGIEEDVARHYTHGSLERAILDGLRGIGRLETGIRPEDLAAVDEFHMGGHQATLELAGQLGLGPGMTVLDIGSGLGGPARTFARHHGCAVTGIDLTPEYVAVATALTGLVGLAGLVRFQVGSALALPFGAVSFDAATLLHVGMNIPDKAALAAEAARVLKPGGSFAVYDVMRVGPGELEFPVAWAAGPETSFLATPEEYRRAFEAAGLRLISEVDRRGLAIDMFRRMRARIAESGPPPLGLHLLMGAGAPVKVANLLRGLEQGRIAPVEMICRRD